MLAYRLRQVPIAKQPDSGAQVREKVDFGADEPDFSAQVQMLTASSTLL